MSRLYGNIVSRSKNKQIIHHYDICFECGFFIDLELVLTIGALYESYMYGYLSLCKGYVG